MATKPSRTRSVAFVDEGLGNSSYLVDLGDGPRWWSTRPVSRIPGRRRTPPTGLDDRVRRPTPTRTPTSSPAAPSSRARRRHVPRPGAAGLECPAPRRRPTATRSTSAGSSCGPSPRPATPPSTSPTSCRRRADAVALFSGGSLMVGAVGPHRPARRRADRGARPRAVPVAARADPDPARRPRPCTRPTGPGRSARRRPGSDADHHDRRERATNPLLAARRRGRVRRHAARRARQLPALLPPPPRESTGAAPRLRPAIPPLAAARPPTTCRRASHDGARRSSTPGPSPRSPPATSPASLSIALRPQFATWLGWLVALTTPLVFVLDDDQDRGRPRPPGLQHRLRQLARRARRRHRRLARGRAARRGDAARHRRPHGPDTVLDVRQRQRVRRRPRPRAPSTSSSATLADATALPAGPVTVMCGHGERAMTARQPARARRPPRRRGARRRARGLGRPRPARRSRPRMTHADARPSGPARAAREPRPVQRCWSPSTRSSAG